MLLMSQRPQGPTDISTEDILEADRKVYLCVRGILKTRPALFPRKKMMLTGFSTSVPFWLPCKICQSGSVNHDSVLCKVIRGCVNTAACCQLSRYHHVMSVFQEFSTICICIVAGTFTATLGLPFAVSCQGAISTPTAAIRSVCGQMKPCMMSKQPKHLEESKAEPNPAEKLVMDKIVRGLQKDYFRDPCRHPALPALNSTQLGFGAFPAL